MSIPTMSGIVRRALPALLASLSLAALLAGCAEDDLAGTSTETVSGKTVGALYLADGAPARGARVRVLPVGYQPLADTGRSLAFRTSTDDKGRYYIDSLAAGEYNILGELDGEAAYQDSIFLSGTARTLASDTLEEPGTVCGYVALQPGDLLASATVQLLGTQAYANVDDDGFFTLPPLAPGLYRAAVDADLPGYTTFYASVRVRSGRTDTLADTLKPRFTGIPQVMGLKAEFDTLKQVVSLSWAPSTFPNLQDYVVLRAPLGSVQGYQIIGSTRTTSYRDTLRYTSDPFGFPDAIVPEWEYRVAIRDKFGDMGRTFGGVEVLTPPPAAAQTMVTLRALGTRDGAVSIGDTVLLVAEWQGTGRDMTLLRWFRPDTAEAVRSVAVTARSGKDTLRFICPQTASNHGFRVEIADEGGAEWMAASVVNVRLDPPTIRMQPSVSSYAGEKLPIHADVADGLGRIAKIEWDIGGTGNWLPTLGNDTVITLPNMGKSSYLCIGRVTDDDGLTALDTTDVYVSPWSPLPRLPAPVTGSSAAAVNGKIYMFGANDGTASSATHEYDPDTRIWRERSGMPRIRQNFAVVEAGGMIYVFGGRDGAGSPIGKADRYDPQTDLWTTLADMPGTRFDHGAVALNGLIYLIGGDSYGIKAGTTGLDRMKAIDVYDPATDSWSAFNTSIPFERKMKTVVANGKIYAFSQENNNSGKYATFDPINNVWENLGMMPFASRTMSTRLELLYEYEVVSFGGRIVVAGGFWRHIGGSFPDGGTDKVHVLDLASKNWSTMLPWKTAKGSVAMVPIGNTLYCLGGMWYIWALNTPRLSDFEVSHQFE